MAGILILSVLHLIGDFYLQPFRSGSVNGEMRFVKALFSKKRLLQAFLYTVPFLLLFGMADPMKVLTVIAALPLFHYALDTVSCFLRKKLNGTLVFITDQCLHAVMLFAVYTVIDFRTDVFRYEFAIKIIFAALFLTVPSAAFISELFSDLFSDTEQGKLFDVGSIIGILERILVFIFACFEDFAAIAIIITVKTWARSSDLKDKIDFRNKYLLGTLASLVLALIPFLICKL